MFIISACGGRPDGIRAPNNLLYPEKNISAVVGQPLPPFSPKITGTATLFAITPNLPPGLSFDSNTGTISGTPTNSSAEATYTVTAGNSAGVATTVFQLSIAGFVPDLRFQWTGAFDAYRAMGPDLTIGTPPPGAGAPAFSYTGFTHWGPLDISTRTEDGWSCFPIGIDVPLVNGTTSIYLADQIGSMNQRLDEWANQGMVVTSLDISVQGFGVVVTGPQFDNTEYISTRINLPTISDLMLWAYSQGAKGAVITAIATSGKNSSIRSQVAISSTRRGDPGPYDTQIISGTPLDLSQALPILGLQGYVVTAFGAGDQSNFIAVGTRSSGHVTPHDIRVYGPGLAVGPSGGEGYALVGRMSTPAGGTGFTIYQR